MYVDKHSYLGVTLETNLRWQYHLQEISTKATGSLNLIKRNFWFCEQDTKRTFYKALVRPKMEYASAVWDRYHQCDIDKLENIQRAAVCKNEYRHTSSHRRTGNVLPGGDGEPFSQKKNRLICPNIYETESERHEGH